MTSLTIGKLRRLQQCATPDGKLVILAVDHRHSLRKALNPHNPDSVPAEALVAFKRQVVAALAPAASAVLLDGEYGAEQTIASGALPRDAGLIVSMERSGYAGTPTARLTETVPGWTPQRAARIGAAAIKLLVYYHPEASTAPQVEELARQTAAACAEAEVPLFLEPLTYSLDPNRPKLSPEERRCVIIETARQLTAIPGVDVLKAEFPLDSTVVHDEAEWLAACQELTEASRVPWVLLSAGVDFETFLHQTAAAGRAGASGVAVGRAVWQEATAITAAARVEFLTTVARQRMERVAALCKALAFPWNSRR